MLLGALIIYIANFCFFTLEQIYASDLGLSRTGCVSLDCTGCGSLISLSQYLQGHNSTVLLVQQISLVLTMSTPIPGLDAPMSLLPHLGVVTMT